AAPPRPPPSPYTTLFRPLATGTLRPPVLLPSPPVLRGRGVGGEGAWTVTVLAPHPRPLSPEYRGEGGGSIPPRPIDLVEHSAVRSEEHTAELQSPYELVC